ncbi:hypothetical protein HPB48_025452 [Haemaphysalis longicornis]|uniref:SERRATE/Ars2 C-terminal domain-containing protein n=1 Tax=Haemaphysalis longicornis TaxID=44386 RepID=A0A9J6H7K2_HAELO|nr:hypothetical protein HPB48_025452 [Haemaphysalis longicornis]
MCPTVFSSLFHTLYAASPSLLLWSGCVKDSGALRCLLDRARTREVEKFVVANTQELAKDKWLCPLSGKKFKGPEFVRKHIFNKHGEKVEEVRKEVRRRRGRSSYLFKGAATMVADL